MVSAVVDFFRFMHKTASIAGHLPHEVGNRTLSNPENSSPDSPGRLAQNIPEIYSQKPQSLRGCVKTLCQQNIYSLSFKAKHSPELPARGT